MMPMPEDKKLVGAIASIALAEIFGSVGIATPEWSVTTIDFGSSGATKFARGPFRVLLDGELLSRSLLPCEDDLCYVREQLLSYALPCPILYQDAHLGFNDTHANWTKRQCDSPMCTPDS